MVVAPLQGPCVFRLAAGTGARHEGVIAGAASLQAPRHSGLRGARQSALCPGRRARSTDRLDRLAGMRAASAPR